MKKFRATNNYVVVLPKLEDRTASGIFLPKTDEPTAVGTVVSVGDMVHYLGEGDVVFYNSTASEAIKIEGVNHRVVKSTDIYGAWQ